MISRDRLHTSTIFWRTFSALCLLLAGFLIELSAAHGQVINEYVAVCDPAIPTNCQKYNANGAGNVIPYGPMSNYWVWTTNGSSLTAGASITIAPAPGINLRNYLGFISCPPISGSGSEVQIVDGSSFMLFDSGNSALGISPQILLKDQNTNSPLTLKVVGGTTVLFCTVAGLVAP